MWYANALVDPDDPEDLFPRDFIVSLDRPNGYMGVSDFFDPTTVYEDLAKDDYSLSEIAHIRRVEHSLGADDEDLKEALRSYVLAGGLKLFRQAIDPNRYKAEHFKHHTMLVHTSQRTGEHLSLAERLEKIWNRCAFNGPHGREELSELWDRDHAKVSAAIGNEANPKSFSELIPYLSDAIKRIEKGPRILLIVNSEKSEAPDFSAAPVWKIVVGGNKLSRGYTIEGLTVSYYRRVAGTADTLMQMGRWFGFRPGYQDLVRVFLGVKEGRRGDTDLVALFKEVCFLEEQFRDEIKRYVRRPGEHRITPKEIPPMISAAGSLPPTARNKMFNAALVSKNFGGQWSMLTLAAIKPAAINENVKTLKSLLGVAQPLGRQVLGGTSSEGSRINAEVLSYQVTTSQLLAFLNNYRWLETDYQYPERPADAGLQLEFLEKHNHGITSWLIIAPQRQSSFGPPLEIAGVANFAVKNRRRLEGRGFQVFGEPTHRTIAKFLAVIESENSKLVVPNALTQSWQDPHRGICLLYPVRERETDEVSIGFELLFPKNNLKFDVNFTVLRPAQAGSIAVQVPQSK